jgi:hypothetical protein
VKLRNNQSIFIAVVITWLLALSFPAVADGVRHALFAHNADKVDGKHAVGAGASAQKRAGKLVATNGKGKLPTNIVDGLIVGSGRSKANRLALGADPNFKRFFLFPGMGEIQVRCGTDEWGVRWAHPKGISGYWEANNDGDPAFRAPHGPGNVEIEMGRSAAGGQIWLQAGAGTRANTRLYSVSMSIAFDDVNDRCYFHGHALTQGDVAIRI